MKSKDFELERLRGEMDSAQRVIDSAKSRLDALSPRRDSIKREIDSCKYRIADIKHSIDEEYRMMKICFERNDRIDASTHKWNAESYKNALQREYEIKNSYYSQMDGMKSDYESALSALREAKSRKQRAREAFNARLEIVRAENERARAQWKETRCKKCGATIRYHADWEHIPTICKSCKSGYAVL